MLAILAMIPNALSVRDIPEVSCAVNVTLKAYAVGYGAEWHKFVHGFDAKYRVQDTFEKLVQNAEGTMGPDPDDISKN